jgi:selenocysteine lyase/cysteine desulfurase
VGLHTSKLAGDAARYVKRCLGAGPQDMLLFCGTGCTAAIKRLQEVTGMAVPPPLRALALAALPPSERWVVFVGPYEHHSNLLTWRESLAEVVEIGLRPEGDLLDLSALESALAARSRSGRPMLGSFSACSNVTGLRTDTRAVARLLHRHGAYACFDFACSAPYVRVDMRSGDADGYDAVFMSPHKFLGGPGSPGVLAMARRMYRLGRTAPSTSGGGTVLYVSAQDTVYSDDAEEREDAGTPAIIQKVRAALAFRVKEWVGEACVEAQEARMLALAHQRIRAAANPNLRLLLEADPAGARRLPVLSFVVSANSNEKNLEQGRPRLQLHSRFVTKLLNDLFGVQARAGCACAGPYGHRLLGITPARAKSIRSAVELVIIIYGFVFQASDDFSVHRIIWTGADDGDRRCRAISGCGPGGRASASPTTRRCKRPSSCWTPWTSWPASATGSCRSTASTGKPETGSTTTAAPSNSCRTKSAQLLLPLLPLVETKQGATTRITWRMLASWPTSCTPLALLWMAVVPRSFPRASTRSWFTSWFEWLRSRVGLFIHPLSSHSGRYGSPSHGH